MRARLCFSLLLMLPVTTHAAPKPNALWTQPTRAGAVTFSPDGKHVATGAPGGGNPFTSVELWDATEGTRLEHPDTAGDDRERVLRDVVFSRVDEAWSPDSSLVATIGDDGAIRVQDPKTGRVTRTLSPGGTEAGPAVSVAFSPDGELVAAGTEGPHVRVQAWRVSDGSVVHDLDAGVPPGAYGSALVAFSPNGDFLAAALRERYAVETWGGELRFWNRASGEVAAEYADTVLTSQPGTVSNLAFSPALDHEFAYVLGGRVTVARTPLSLAFRTLAVAPSDDIDQLALAEVSASSQVSFLFTPSTSRHVHVEAFDVQGHRVASLFDGDVRAGVPALWTLDGGALPGGQYLVHVRGDGFEVVREFNLAK